LQQYNDFVFLTVGIGIGAGIVVNKKLFDGSNHSAGEFGHMTIIEGGLQCSCGNRGCLETYASDRATVNSYNSALTEKEQTVSNIEELITRYKAGDRKAENSLQESAKFIGIGISNIIKAIDPQAIVVGGKITQAWDIVKPVMMELLAKRNIFGIEQELAVLPSSLSIRPRLLGAATLAIREIFHDYQITK